MRPAELVASPAWRVVLSLTLSSGLHLTVPSFLKVHARTSARDTPGVETRGQVWFVEHVAVDTEATPSSPNQPLPSSPEPPAKRRAPGKRHLAAAPQTGAALGSEEAANVVVPTAGSDGLAPQSAYAAAQAQSGNNALVQSSTRGADEASARAVADREAEALASNQPPPYPRAARRAGIEGVVVARIFVNEDGLVGPVEIVRGHEIFRDAVRGALLRWRYRPAIRHGQFVATTRTVHIPYSLTRDLPKGDGW